MVTGRPALLAASMAWTRAALSPQGILLVPATATPAGMSTKKTPTELATAALIAKFGRTRRSGLMVSSFFPWDPSVPTLKNAELASARYSGQHVSN